MPRGAADQAAGEAGAAGHLLRARWARLDCDKYVRADDYELPLLLHSMSRKERHRRVAAALEKNTTIRALDLYGDPDVRAEQLQHIQEALWKNVFAGEGDRRAAAALARYVRRELASLEMTELDTVLHGDLAFRDQD